MAECHARQHDIAHIAAAAPEEARILEPGHALADREFTHLASSEISKGSQLIAKPWRRARRSLRAGRVARVPASTFLAISMGLEARHCRSEEPQCRSRVMERV